MPTAGAHEKSAYQLQQDRYHELLQNLLQEEANKYCSDCAAKGPRWASHSLGVFICIRCAGIHRNLGVHISRVKSVNLDAWTEDQISTMLAIGNRRAKAIYEAKLSDNYLRPSTETSLDAFIRSKYEQHKFVSDNYQELVRHRPSEVDEILRSLRIDQLGSKKKSPIRSNNNNKHAGSGAAPTIAPPPSGRIVRPPPPSAFQVKSNTPIIHHSEGDVNKIQVPPPPPKETTSATPVDLLGFDEPASRAQVGFETNAFEEPNSNSLEGLDFGAAAPSAGVGGGGTVPPSNNVSLMPRQLFDPAAASSANVGLTTESILSLYSNAKSKATTPAGFSPSTSGFGSSFVSTTSVAFQSSGPTQAQLYAQLNPFNQTPQQHVAATAPAFGSAHYHSPSMNEQQERQRQVQLAATLSPPPTKTTTTTAGGAVADLFKF